MSEGAPWLVIIGLGEDGPEGLSPASRAALERAVANGGVHTGEVVEHRHPGGHCPRCGTEMVHGTVGGRSTWWCPQEQV